MEEEKKKVESTLKELEGKKSDTAAYVKELDRNLSALAGELTKLEGDISQKEEQIEEAKVELETAKITENRQYEDMKLRIQYMYENGQTGLFGVHDAVREHCRAFKPGRVCQPDYLL